MARASATRTSAGGGDRVACPRRPTAPLSRIARRRHRSAGFPLVVSKFHLGVASWANSRLQTPEKTRSGDQLSGPGRQGFYSENGYRILIGSASINKAITNRVSEAGRFASLHPRFDQENGSRCLLAVKLFLGALDVEHSTLHIHHVEIMGEAALVSLVREGGSLASRREGFINGRVSRERVLRSDNASSTSPKAVRMTRRYIASA
jgi:hypothetical protein